MSTDTTSGVIDDSVTKPKQPTTARQMGDQVNALALSIQCRANCCQSLVDAIIDSLDAMSVRDPASRLTYSRAVNLVEVLRDYLAPVSDAGGQLETLSMQICKGAVA